MSKKLYIFIILLFSISRFSVCLADDISSLSVNAGAFSDTQTRVIDSHTFYGLAAYYNDVRLFWVTGKEIVSADSISIPHDGGGPRWLAQVGRFNVVVWDTSNISFDFIADNVDLDEISRAIEDAGVEPKVLQKPELIVIAPELDQIRYQHLWRPLAKLTKLIEACLMGINALLLNWGASIIVYCILVKALLLPLSLFTAKLQRDAGLIKKALSPKLVEIKSLYDGEEAHTKIMSAHKELGVGPFYSLKPLFSTMVQIPLLIATFNALGEMSQIDGSDFLWIGNLAYPDKIFSLSLTIPWLGDGFNLLPLLMALVSVVATILFTNNYDSGKEIAKQKLSLYFMAGGFLLLFYPFPAAMVLYWMMSNFLHLVQQRLIK